MLANLVENAPFSDKVTESEKKRISTARQRFRCGNTGITTVETRKDGNKIAYETTACPHCNGTGKDQDPKFKFTVPKPPCVRCNGTGSEKINNRDHLLEEDGTIPERFLGSDSEWRKHLSQLVKIAKHLGVKFVKETSVAAPKKPTGTGVENRRLASAKPHVVSECSQCRRLASAAQSSRPEPQSSYSPGMFAIAKWCLILGLLILFIVVIAYCAKPKRRREPIIPIWEAEALEQIARMKSESYNMHKTT